MIDLDKSLNYLTRDCPSWSKGSDLRPDVLRHAWVQIPHYTPHPLNSVWSECHSYKVEVASSSLAVGTKRTCPSWSKGSDLRPDVFRYAWVQIPQCAVFL